MWGLGLTILGMVVAPDGATALFVEAWQLVAALARTAIAATVTDALRCRDRVVLVISVGFPLMRFAHG